MKEYRVQVVATVTMEVSEADWREAGGVGEFDESRAAQYAQDLLDADLCNNPNCVSVKVERIK